MAAAVACVANVERTTSASKGRRKSTRVQTKRRLKTRFSMLSWVMLIAVGLMLPFAYTNVYANLKKTSYSKNDYEVMRWRENVDNQRLKILVDRYSGYTRIKAGAVKLGMVPTTNYDYVDQTQTVASR